MDDDLLVLGIAGIKTFGVEVSDEKLEARVRDWYGVALEEEILAMNPQGEKIAKDASIGQVLRPDLVREAHRKELE